MRDWERYLLANRDRHLAGLNDFLRIPSVSALPEHAASVELAAHWVARCLAEAGLEHAAVLPTGGHPVVYADWLHAPDGPTVLIYGHFDVEPAGDVSGWSHPPFEPVVRNGRIYARGASDDKGNLLIPIVAAEALLRTTGALPVNVKFLLEGQEEIGSPDLPAFVAAHRELLACDVVLSADGGQWSEEQPALTLGCRGLAALEVKVSGPTTDLHSGVFGGTVQNPAHALARIIASLHDAEGSVSVDGFYDGIGPVPAIGIDFDEEAYRKSLGVPELFGEPGYTTLARSWLRPTIEVNGLHAGQAGPGVQAIVPAEAGAQITCRLVEGQQPDRILDLVEQHVVRSKPPGVNVTVRRLPGKARPYHMAADHPVNQAAAQVLAEVYGRAPLQVRMGATIPVCGLFRDLLGADTVLFAFGLDDENIHGPDEFFRLRNWDQGCRAYCLLLERLRNRTRVPGLLSY